MNLQWLWWPSNSLCNSNSWDTPSLPMAWDLLTFLLHCVLKSYSICIISKETQLKRKIQSRNSHLANLTWISRYLDITGYNIWLNFNSKQKYLASFFISQPVIQCLHSSWKWKSLSRVQLCNPKDCSPPDSSGIF